MIVFPKDHPLAVREYVFHYPSAEARGVRVVQSHPVHSVVGVATAAAMDALPERLSYVRWRLLRAFRCRRCNAPMRKASRLTPVAYVQHQCLLAASACRPRSGRQSLR